DRIVWIDLETTGLEPHSHHIVEIGCIVTDGDLNPLDPGIAIVVKAPPIALGNLSEFVWNMHRDSGLLDLIPFGMRPVDAEETVLNYIKTYIPDPNTAPLAGSSVHFDRAFLADHMGSIDAYLHYRHIDVSTVKQLVARWNPDAATALPASREIHRALPDLQDSIAELLYYRSVGLTAAA
ncbi:MAG: oligoribonuclease, partial [bacterium]|nr:oligoribonuclease [bacterium]